jgi:hypothetical protein
VKLDLGPINIKFDISVAAPALAKKFSLSPTMSYPAFGMALIEGASSAAAGA